MTSSFTVFIAFVSANTRPPYLVLFSDVHILFVIILKSHHPVTTAHTDFIPGAICNPNRTRTEATNSSYVAVYYSVQYSRLHIVTELGFDLNGEVLGYITTCLNLNIFQSDMAGANGR